MRVAEFGSGGSFASGVADDADGTIDLAFGQADAGGDEFAEADLRAALIATGWEDFLRPKK